MIPSQHTLIDFERDIDILSTKILGSKKIYQHLYPVPRGGIPVAMALSQITGIPLTDTITPKTLIIDDLVDSGSTRSKYPDNDFACIHIKKHTPKELYPEYFIKEEDCWIEYWWERIEEKQPAEDAVIRIIESIGDDPNREGLIDTPRRVIKSYQHLFSGYNKDPKDVMTIFNNEGCNQIVLLKDIEIYSMCEHHLLPLYGRAHLAYVPDKKIIGISKLARLIEIYTRRLQIQERIGEQVTSDLMKYLNPLGAACIIEADHLCMRMRGVEKQNSTMVTSSLKGIFLDDLSARRELMSLIK